MKKWMYIIFPGAMLALFLVVFTSHKKDAEEREHRRAEALAQKIAADKAQKDEAEKRAAADAQKRQIEREEEDRKKEEERRRKQQAIDNEIRDQTAKAKADGDKSQKEVSALELKLDTLRKQQEQLGKETFEIAKDVELARVAKRNAELQEQHMTQMIAQRAELSSMASMPPPPPQPK